MFKYLFKILTFLFIKKKESTSLDNNLSNVCLKIYTELNDVINLNEATLLFNYFQPRVSNVDEYILLLDTFTRKIRNGQIIKSEDIPDYQKECNLELFFTDRNKNYLDPNESLSDLINSTIGFCHELLIDQTDVGVHEHNRIVTIPILNDLIDIAVVLNK